MKSSMKKNEPDGARCAVRGARLGHPEIRFRRLAAAFFLFSAFLPAQERPRIRDLGVKPGVLTPGKWNAITDVAGVRVGHKTIIEGDAVRIGLGYVQDLGPVGAETAVQAREEAGRFRSLFDFLHRTGLQARPVENLIRVGAFEELGLNRRELLWQLGLLLGPSRQSVTRPRPLFRRRTR